MKVKKLAGKLDDNLQDFYYVYEHWLDGQLFYVGKGKKDRALSTDRNSLWKEYTKHRLDEVEVKIKGYFPDERDAFLFESTLINKYTSEGVLLVNINLNLNLKKSFSNSGKIKEEMNLKQKKGQDEEGNFENLDLIFFNNKKQVINAMKEEIKNDNKSKFVVLYDSISKGLIEALYNEDSLAILNTKQFTSIGVESLNKKEDFIKILRENKIPDSYNVILSSISDFNLHGLFIKDENIKSVILNTSKNYNLDSIQKIISGDYKILKRTLVKKINIKNLALKIPEEYINVPLSSKDKANLCKSINVVNSNGYSSSWTTIKKILTNDSKYEIKDATKNIEGKRTRITIISKSE